MSNFELIEETFKGEPPFRIKQIKSLIFKDLISDWDQATVLPVEMRKKLNEIFPLAISSRFFISKKENSVKALIILKDGLKIETVLMRHSPRFFSDHELMNSKEERRSRFARIDEKNANISLEKKWGKDRNTVCVSSQVGCPLACAFCATGQRGFKRNLDKWEIVEQVLLFARWLKNRKSLGSDYREGSRDCFVVPLRGTPRNDIINKINNVVFMGMGEPFLNYDNVLAAIKILNDKEGFNLGARHFSISTVGITEGIEKLAQEKMEVNLAISLHAPNDKLRSSIMPINKKYPLGKILRAVDEYIKQTRRRVMFEYIMIEEINDSDDCARQLADLLKNTLGFVNLITYNPTGIFKPSSSQRLNKFKEILEKAGVAVTQRYRFGDDIKGACGQLAGNANNN